MGTPSGLTLVRLHRSDVNLPGIIPIIESAKVFRRLHAAAIWEANRLFLMFKSYSCDAQYSVSTQFGSQLFGMPPGSLSTPPQY